MFIAVAILIFLMIFIVPKFKEMFANTDQELPLISKIVFGTSEFMLARPFVVPIDDALAALDTGAVANALLVNALQWLARHRARLRALLKAA